MQATSTRPGSNSRMATLQGTSSAKPPSVISAWCAICGLQKPKIIHGLNWGREQSDCVRDSKQRDATSDEPSVDNLNQAMGTQTSHTHIHTHTHTREIQVIKVDTLSTWHKEWSAVRSCQKEKTVAECTKTIIVRTLSSTPLALKTAGKSTVRVPNALRSEASCEMTENKG